MQSEINMFSEQLSNMRFVIQDKDSIITRLDFALNRQKGESGKFAVK